VDIRKDLFVQLRVLNTMALTFAQRMFAHLMLFHLATAALPRDYPSVPINGSGGVIAMPLYGLGTWLYNSTVAEKAATMALAMGYRHIDTASDYENQDGVGRALKSSGLHRNEYFVTSKIPGGLNASATMATANQCLEQLGLSYVDLMLIHFPATFDGKGGKAARKEEWKALEKWAKSGKARAIGVSHYCARQIKDIQEVATLPIAVNQVQYHVGMGSAGPMANDDKEFVQSQGILYQSFSSLCGPCNPPDNHELINGSLVTEIGKAHGKTGAQVSLKWLVQQGIPVIPKSQNPVHLRQNMDLFDFELTSEEMARLTAATTPATAAGPNPHDSGDCGVAIDEADVEVHV